ncbi:carbohydrate sulfotransferase 1-like [Saccoglossus kowalevskii]
MSQTTESGVLVKHTVPPSINVSIKSNNRLGDALYDRRRLQNLLQVQDAFKSFPKTLDMKHFHQKIDKQGPLALVVPGAERTMDVERERTNLSINRNGYINATNYLDQSTITRPRTHVLIVTNRRSGSSFLGQVFNQNPDVFFNFEPLKVLEYAYSYQELQKKSSVFLNNVFGCNFQKLSNLVEFYNKDGFHRSSSQVLSSPPFCNIKHVTKRTAKRCPFIDADLLSKECMSKYKHVAIKIIRLVDIQTLESLLSDLSINVKIIHLVRDPRAIYNSRSNAEKFEKTLTGDHVVTVQSLCRRIKQNYGTGKNQPPWLQDKYMLVRYEDLARNPMQITQDMYRFLEFGTVPPVVNSWIVNNTYSNESPLFNDRYSTKRNSSVVVEAWRRELPYRTVEQIQIACGDVLNDLGYQHVFSEAQLLNMTKSIVLPVP